MNGADETGFIVRDTARLANIFPHLVLACFVAAPLVLALTHEGFQTYLESQRRGGGLEGFIRSMTVVNIAMAADLTGLFLNLFSNRPALRVTAEGVSGHYGWLWRNFTWDKVDHVSVGTNHIQIVRRPHTPFGYLLAMRPKGNKLRAGDQIYVKLSTADRDVRDILFEIEKRCPGLEIISSPFLRSSLAPHRSVTRA